MNTLTVSHSGTAWIKDSQAQGKSAAEGWTSSPNAAYYASLDHEAASPQASAPTLPNTLAELIKLQQSATSENQDDLADQLQRQMAKVAAANGLAASGNLINVSA